MFLCQMMILRHLQKKIQFNTSIMLHGLMSFSPALRDYRESQLIAKDAGFSKEIPLEKDCRNDNPFFILFNFLGY